MAHNFRDHPRPFLVFLLAYYTQKRGIDHQNFSMEYSEIFDMVFSKILDFLHRPKSRSEAPQRYQ